jgi:hypothetical protein
MGACVALISGALHATDLVEVGVSVGAGAILYLAFSQVAGVEERMILLGFLRGRRRAERKGNA